MTTSVGVFSTENYSDTQLVIIDISERRSEQSGHGVCVCRVPIRFLSSAKEEAFVPQYAGLGPYHHKRKLIITKELKLGVAKRFLKLEYDTDVIHQILQEIVIDIQPFYHVDVRFTCDDRHLLTVDGLFLLALLHTGVTAILKANPTYFLTGRWGMPLVDAAGLELTRDGIIRDLFMLENQIPAHFLKQISEANINCLQEIQDKNLGSSMLKFCEALRPLVHMNKLSRRPEDYVHLLDLMYHLIAQPEPKGESETNSQIQPDSHHQPEPSRFKIFMRLTFVYLFVVIWIMYSVFMFCFMLVGQILRLVELYLLRKVIPWMSEAESVDMPVVPYILRSTINLLLGHIAIGEIEFSFLKPYIQIFRPIERRVCGLFQKRDSTNSSDKAVIPSATELKKFGFRFEPAEGGISSIKFKKNWRQFYLPCIRLDATSEVITRNLLTYESLRENSNCLIYTRFVKLMSALIVTAEDVKLLEDSKIIQKTKLSHEDVAQLFKGMSDSVNAEPEEMEELDQVIKSVNAYILHEQHATKMDMQFKMPISIYLFFSSLFRIIAVLAARQYTSSFTDSNHHTAWIARGNQ